MWLAVALGLAMAAPLEGEPDGASKGGPANLVVESRTAFRSDLGVGGTFGLGLRARATPRWTFEAMASVVSMRTIRVNGPQRGWMSPDLSASMLYMARPWLAIGPTAGISYRLYRQQWNDIGQVVMPEVGVAGDATVLRARWFALGVAGRGTVDLGRTEYVLETSQVVVQSPWDMQLGLRTTFGWPMPKSERPARKERR